MKNNFWDIESFDNVFTLANFKEQENHIDIYYLCDNPELMVLLNFEQALINKIYERNANFRGTVTVYDLNYEGNNDHLFQEFGLSDAEYVNNPDLTYTSTFKPDFRPRCDTDHDYDIDNDPFILGYNSANYDTTMLAWYANSVYSRQILTDNYGNKTGVNYFFNPVKAADVREFNNVLFSPEFKKNMPSALAYEPETLKKNGYKTYGLKPDYKTSLWRIRKAMLMSGRHLDVAKINEKQKHMGLKNLLGIMGYQILESDFNNSTITTTEEVLELIANNVSDIVNLAELYKHKFYKGRFDLKRGLLKTYPELIYEKKRDEYAPDISSKRVMKNRLTIDDTSANFAARTLCPYGRLDDNETVSYMFPSPEIAKELGIKPFNVLDMVMTEYEKLFPKGTEAYKAFKNVYDYYKQIEGKNFNESDYYCELYPDTPCYKLKDIKQNGLTMNYYNADDTISSCFVNFSTGGIHGAEINLEKYNRDLDKYNKEKAEFDYIKKYYPNPLQLLNIKNSVGPDGKKAKWVELPDKTLRNVTKYIKSGATIKALTPLTDLEAASYYKETTLKRPELYKEKQKDGETVTELNKEYTYTSAGLTNHEDFVSYYPNLLRKLAAFYNFLLGYDRYGEIFDNKEKYGKLMKDKSILEDKRLFYAVQREGTKLILNSASGAGDAKFTNNIQMNNNIISMRIIGQLFTFYIGAVQTYYGAKVISTNTDGLYTILEAELNEKLLNQAAKDIHVEIEPEPLYLISKDSNNRIEVNADSGKVEKASGLHLGCYFGPNPTLSLPHPAIIDRVLGDYLIAITMGNAAATLDDMFDEALGKEIFDKTISEYDSVELLKMFQWILKSEPSSIRYIFGTRPNDKDKRPVILQRYNRAFITTTTDMNTFNLEIANGKAVPEKTRLSRTKKGIRPINHSEKAVHILKKYGVDIQKDLTLENREASITKITNLEPDWNAKIVNESLYTISEEQRQALIKSLDLSVYLGLVKQFYDENWTNYFAKE